MTCNKQTTNGYYGAISSWLPFAPSAGSWLEAAGGLFDNLAGDNRIGSYVSGVLDSGIDGHPLFR